VAKISKDRLIPPAKSSGGSSSKLPRDAYEQSQAAIASRTAGYQRRADEWMLQANLAARELMQIGEQVIASLIQEQFAYHDFQNDQDTGEAGAGRPGFSAKVR
jgi:hypothetical protein